MTMYHNDVKNLHMNMEEILTTNEIKTQERLKTVGKALEVFGLFWEIGLRTKAGIYAQLCMNFPQYRSPEGRYAFGLLWNFVKYDTQMLKHLEDTLDAINAK